MCKKEDKKENYAFHFLNDVEHPVVRLHAVGKERCSTDAYFWANDNRPDCYLFQYTLSGSGTVKISGKEEIVGQGTGFFLKLPGSECYYFDEEKNEAPWEFIYLLFEGGAAEEYCRYIENHLGRIISVPVYSRAIELLFELHGQAKRPNENPFLLGSMVFSFLCALCDTGKEGEKAEPLLVTEAKEYMEQLFAKPSGISDVAEMCHVSQSHLSREFYKATGMKPSEYLTKLRLEKAVDLLSSTSVQLAQISTACGFSSTNYFQKVFRKHMKMSPAQFRKYVKKEGYLKFQI